MHLPTLISTFMYATLFWTTPLKSSMLKFDRVRKDYLCVHYVYKKKTKLFSNKVSGIYVSNCFLLISDSV